MTTPRPDWPVLRRYDGDHLARIALPLGGIGTGTVSLGGRGDLRDWEVVNRPAKGFTPGWCFFALRVQPEGGKAVTRALEGPLDLSLFEGGSGSTAPNHGLPRFRSAAFEAAYPLGQVLLSDPDVPLDVCLQAFNPLIPGDADRSGLPLVVLRFVLTNRTDKPVSASVCGSLPNFIGNDGTTRAAKGNVNAFRRGGGLAGIFLRSEGVDPQGETWGTMALAALLPLPSQGRGPGGEATHRTAWASLSWGDTLLDFWDDFHGDGQLDEREPGGTDTPMASLAAPVEIGPNGAGAVTFLLTWHFPNRMTWSPGKGGTAAAPGGGCCAEGEACGKDGNPNWIGNHYATRFRDAWDVAVQTEAHLASLEADTVAFVRAFCDATCRTW
jgi:uncharacterized protein (DUF608 family)